MWILLIIFLIIPSQCFASIYSIMMFNASHDQVQDNEKSSADIEYQRIRNEQARESLEELRQQSQEIDSNNAKEQQLANDIKSNPNAFNIEHVPGKFYDGYYVSEHYVVTAKSN